MEDVVFEDDPMLRAPASPVSQANIFQSTASRILEVSLPPKKIEARILEKADSDRQFLVTFTATALANICYRMRASRIASQVRADDRAE